MRREPGQDFNLPELDQLLARLGQWRTRLPGWWMIIFVILAIWAASGIYIVNPDQIGVVQRFGAYRYTTNPGPHWRLPWPIESVTKPRVTKVERLEIGFRTYAGGGAPGQFRSEPAEALMLTGDENIVKLEFIVQYRIKDPMDYLFRVRDQVATIKQAAEAAMREVIGKRKIDEALTEGKAQIQSDTQVLLQEILDKYQAGVKIVAVQLQDVHPPDEVLQAFRDVASAKEDKSRLMNEAEGYRNDVVPKARGEAAKLVKEAEAYKEVRIDRSEGDAQRFQKLLAEYQRAPEVTRKRLYLEAMEELLPNLEKFILEKESGRSIVPYLPLERKPKAEAAPEKP